MSVASPPTVGVYIVTRNRTDALRRCLQSIRAQTRAPAEVLVVDNGSTDGTAALVRSEFPEASLLETKSNLGCPRGRTIAAEHASADLLLFIDDDCVLVPDAVERAAEAALGDELIAIFAPRIIETRNGRRWALLDGPRRDVARFVGACAIRRCLVPKNGLYPVSFPNYGEEQALGLQLIERGLRIVYEPSIVIHHFPDSVARDHNLEMVWGVQNPLFVKWCFLPYRYAIGSTAQTLTILLSEAIRTRTLRGYFRGIIGLSAVVARAIRDRRPVTAATWRRYRQLRAFEGDGPVPLDDDPGR
jgi:GT2 family glycosyltransferase